MTQIRFIPLCTPVESGGCDAHGPTCPTPGKRPLKADWASSWTMERPAGNAGVLCGPESGLLVIDVDTPESLQQYKAWQLPETFTVKSGRDGVGYHYYFRWPAGLLRVPNRLDGVEVKGPGRQVVAWDSLHASGRRYERLGGSFAELPQGFVSRLRDSASQHDITGLVDATPEALEALERLLAVLPDAEEQRDGNWQALCPAHDDHDPSLVVTASGDKLLVYCRARCTTDEVLEALGLDMSALWAAPELNTFDASQYLAPDGPGWVEFTDDDTPDTSEADSRSWRPVTPEKARLTRAGLEAQLNNELLDQALLSVDDVLALPPIEWLPGLVGLMQEGTTAEIVAASGSGKSLWVLHHTFRLALRGYKTLYCALEGRNGFNGRLRALVLDWCEQLPPGVDQDAEAERVMDLLRRNVVFYDLSVAFSGDSNDKTHAARVATVDRLRRVMELWGAHIVVIDTLVRAAAGTDENDNAKMQAVIDHADTLRYRSGVGAWLIHHTGHSQLRGRGASSVGAALDNVVTIAPIGEADGKDGRPLVVRVTGTKVKDGPSSSGLIYRKHVVDLGHKLRDGSEWTSVVFHEVTGADAIKAEAEANAERLKARIRKLRKNNPTANKTVILGSFTGVERKQARPLWDEVLAEDLTDDDE